MDIRYRNNKFNYNIFHCYIKPFNMGKDGYFEGRRELS